MSILGIFGKKQVNAAESDSIDDVTGPYPEICETSLEWDDLLLVMIDRLPWFGEHVPAVRPTHRMYGERLTLREDQRLLLSWLAGGSKAQIGRRVGLSRRTVYNRVRRLIYVEEPGSMLADWTRLGLIAVLCTPFCREHAKSGIRWPAWSATAMLGTTRRFLTARRWVRSTWLSRYRHWRT